MRSEIIPGNAISTSRRRSAAVDAQALAAELRAQVRGEVRFDAGSRALYATDASNYRQVPVGVVIPRDADDIVQTVAACRQYGAPILARGGGTSLAGQCCNVAVVLDMSKYMRGIIELDPTRRLARVQPGIVLDDLRQAAEQHHLTFGPDPATHDRCTIGGMIGNNSCGTHSLMAGKTDDNIESLEILTYDGLRMHVGQTSDEELAGIIQAGGRRGEIYARLRALRDTYADLIRARYPQIPRRVSGYNLNQLLPENGFHVARALVGSESTCVTVLEATTRLVHSPPARVLLVLGYPDIYIAGDAVPDLLEYRPIALEGFDAFLVSANRQKGLNAENLPLLPDGNGWLLVEFGGEELQEAVEQAQRLLEHLKSQRNAPHMKLFENPRQTRQIWDVRESALGATAFTPRRGFTWEGWEDAAVPPATVGKYLRDLHMLYEKYDYEGDFYGHFGQGCIHTRINFDLQTTSGIKAYRAFVEEAADLVVSYGGSLSGEHGDGQARAELLPKMFGSELIEAFREFKAIWDPAWKMNPGKLVTPYRLDENLRLGTSYKPPQPHTHFKFPEERGSFARATLRCVGVGKCRKTEAGTMCPSYMVTREEQHSTRGRAHLLFEMLQGDPLKDGWRDEHVREALDLCLACKSCKAECPVNVDMATYKAEFLSHYYQGRLRPITAYSMGLIYWWARLAALAPAVVNFFTQAPVLRAIAKAAMGVAPQRRVPRFATQTFKQWFRQRGPRNVGAPSVLLWPDTFNNYLHPQVAQAAVEVLEALGYHVEVPEPSLCCGRPLYDFGMLDLAGRLLRQVLDTLRPQIAGGMPIIGLEPSCLAVFRDELLNLFPNDLDAQRLSKQSFLLSEFLEKMAPEYQFPQLEGQAIVHAHCHHAAIMKMKDEWAVLARLGLDFQVLDSGCCGMAGSFGFEKEHYDVSIKAGERVLLPAVRAAAPDTLIIADGFSCQEQIAQTTRRRALHLAQVLHMALHSKNPTDRSLAEYPEAQALQIETVHSKALPLIALLGMSAIAGGIIAWLLKKRG
ncbi:MAG: FAD-binding protein [Chloroflexota bacterium]|nr:FAD-binding protein [Chloroflexota bacterium]